MTVTLLLLSVGCAVAVGAEGGRLPRVLVCHTLHDTVLVMRCARARRRGRAGGGAAEGDASVVLRAGQGRAGGWAEAHRASRAISRGIRHTDGWMCAGSAFAQLLRPIARVTGMGKHGRCGRMLRGVCGRPAAQCKDDVQQERRALARGAAVRRLPRDVAVLRGVRLTQHTQRLLSNAFITLE
jgi:hypothetical protein